MKEVIVMPTLNPNARFIDVLKEIRKHFKNVIVVNDGSSMEYDDKFNEAKKLGCIIEKHEINLGKGAAIKTGIESAIKRFPKCIGVVTVDSDGQHLIKDILNVSKDLEENGEFVMGVRNFSSDNVPLKSKFGNMFSSFFFKAKTGLPCQDTQTGLRGIPRKLFDFSLEIPGDRFEYEMNYLYAITEKNYYMRYVDIETVYENKKKHETHFRPFKDSYLIYKEQVKYIVSSVISALLDICLFNIFVNMFNTNLFNAITNATIEARFISGTVNFLLNKYWAFKSNGKFFKEFMKYFTLFILQMCLSFSIVYVVASFITLVSPTIIKLVVDFFLFIAGYLIQKKFIFMKNRGRKKVK